MMKRLFTPLVLLALSLTVLNCKDDDNPGPDLTSSEIKFNWDFTADANANFYAVISDTSGNVLKWDEIVPGTELKMPYPPDGNLANVTLITRLTSATAAVTAVTTFTGLPGSTYTVAPSGPINRKDKDGIFKFGIKNTADFQLVLQFMTGNYEYIDSSESADGKDVTYAYGVYNNEVNNFIAWGTTDPAGAEIKYLYKTGVKADDSVGVSKDTYDADWLVMPFHNITYPQLLQSKGAIFGIDGITIEDDNITIDSRQFSSGATPKLVYADIANLFPKYQTSMTSLDNGGNYHYIQKTAKDPVLSFTNLNAGMDKVIAASTKRIAANMSGEGDMFVVEESYGTSSDRVYYDVYTPMSPKVRISPPQFPQDLIDKVSSLSKLKDQDITEFYAYEYSMSYTDFVSFWFGNDMYGYPPNMRSKIFPIAPGTARTSESAGDVARKRERQRVDFYVK